jgi:4-aminobutyrate aminotransferase-like enzyme
VSTIHHPAEPKGNNLRDELASVEPRAIRTFTPTQAAIARSAGVFHWTFDGRRLYDFTSGVLVSNLGHNPTRWLQRFVNYLEWPAAVTAPATGSGFTPAIPMTAYNALTPVEVNTSARLLKLLRGCPGGTRMEQVMWAASGSEAIQKALWAAIAHDRTRPVILATRFGFHGKKGLAGAVTGSETDTERDPRVRFISFPMTECQDVAVRGQAFDTAPYERELATLLHQFGRKIGCLITEPYLGGGGSYHPPKAYLQLLQRFCRENDIVFILDEIQANFGRTGSLFAFETYGIEPDIVVLGKGLGNGVPVSAAVGRAELFASLDYGEGSDTWSANPLSSAAVLATLDEFETRDIVGQMKPASSILEAGLLALKELPFIAHVRGEKGGMVWGVEFKDHSTRTAAEWANAFVLACYLGNEPGGEGVHLLGPLSKKVVRVAPPLVITQDEAKSAVSILMRAATRLATAPDAITLG